MSSNLIRQSLLSTRRFHIVTNSTLSAYEIADIKVNDVAFATVIVGAVVLKKREF